MNSTPAEFRRALVQAFGDKVSGDETGVLLTTDSAVLHFAFANSKPYQVGALRISLLRVEIDVRCGVEAAARELLAQVDRAIQRGGG